LAIIGAVHEEAWGHFDPNDPNQGRIGAPYTTPDTDSDPTVAFRASRFYENLSILQTFF